MVLNCHQPGNKMTTKGEWIMVEIIEPDKEIEAKQRINSSQIVFRSQEMQN